MNKIGFFIDLLDIHGLKWIREFSEHFDCFIVTHELCENSEIIVTGNNGQPIPVYYILPQTYSVLNLLKKHKTTLRIRQLIASEKPDIVHSMFIEPYSYYADMTNVGHIITSRGSDILVFFRQKNKGFYNKCIRRILDRKIVKILENAKAITSTSGAQHKIISSLITDASKAFVIPTGINLNVFHADNAGAPFWEKSENSFYFFCPRAWKENYNIHILLDAMQCLIRDTNLPFNPVLVLINNYGIKDYETLLLEKISKISQHVIVLPQLNEHAALISAYIHSDAVIMIPDSDGTPNTALEAMALKIPVILGTARYDSLFFNDHTAWFVQSYMPHDVADCMSALMCENQQTLRTKVLNAFQTVGEKGNLDVSVRTMKKIYNQVLNKSLVSADDSVEVNEFDSDIQECSKCLLTNVDEPGLNFNGQGICRHCVEHASFGSTLAVEKSEKLKRFLLSVRESHSTSGYDCIVGLSGGTDSSYLLLKLVDMGVNPLVVHFDNGWNTEFATRNIELLTTKLNVDLYTHVADWEEYRQIQLAFFKASVIDIELITDHAIIALLIGLAKKHNIKYVITGQNSSTETHLPSNWHHFKTDWLNIKSIYRKYGKGRIRSLPHVKFFDLIRKDKYGFPQFVSLLDYIDYNKEQAQKELEHRVGWLKYEGKHFESVFTRFYQGYILPEKFNVDKRKAHLSSLICSGQITKEEARNILQDNHYTKKMISDDLEYVTKKLGITSDEFSEFMKLPVRNHLEFSSYITKHYRYLKLFNSFLKGGKK